ncbi:hypothetical protein BRAS3843_890007 [Bradyrhizobium sp. STM 3843]|nr:hypothetical protein BRAS3843_890007 [Bradyrhizobium sp. STM 3843]
MSHLMPTNNPDAHGQAVWSWRPGADAKLATTFRRRRGQERRSPGRARSSRQNHRAGKAGAIRLSLWFLPRASCSHGGRGYQSMPGLPCTLFFRGSERRCKTRTIRAAGRMTHMRCCPAGDLKDEPMRVFDIALSHIPRRPRMRAIQYSSGRDSPNGLGVLDAPHARGMTTKMMARAPRIAPRIGDPTLGHLTQERHPRPCQSITSSTSSIVISTGLSPRTRRPWASAPV